MPFLLTKTINLPNNTSGFGTIAKAAVIDPSNAYLFYIDRQTSGASAIPGLKRIAVSAITSPTYSPTNAAVTQINSTLYQSLCSDDSFVYAITSSGVIDKISISTSSVTNLTTITEFSGSQACYITLNGENLFCLNYFGQIIYAVNKFTGVYSKFTSLRIPSGGMSISLDKKYLHLIRDTASGQILYRMNFDTKQLDFIAGNGTTTINTGSAFGQFGGNTTASFAANQSNDIFYFLSGSGSSAYLAKCQNEVVSQEVTGLTISNFGGGDGAVVCNDQAGNRIIAASNSSRIYIFENS